ncbi:MAG TPA: hypothetical protein VMX94_06090 [Armatimonadota bacterium]|nr:hypothetical protein [Armatimonadota bacterium]
MQKWMVLRDRVSALIDRAGSEVEITLNSDDLGVCRAFPVVTDTATSSVFIGWSSRLYLEGYTTAPGMGFWFPGGKDIRGWPDKKVPVDPLTAEDDNTRIEYEGVVYCVATAATYRVGGLEIARLAIAYKFMG